jgi:uncharacterized protein YdhG (YjbR/CyaY superfamily)
MALLHIRDIAKQIAPEAEEVVSWGMPGLKYNDKFLLNFAAFKDHLSIFPGAEVIQVLKKELADFPTSKGTIQFTLDQPIPDETLRSIVQFRKDDIEKKK